MSHDSSGEPQRCKLKRENSAAVGLAVERMLCCWNMAGLLHNLDI